MRPRQVVALFGEYLLRLIQALLTVAGIAAIPPAIGAYYFSPTFTTGFVAAVAAALLVASFLVFIRDQAEIKKLNDEKTDRDSRMPKLELGFHVDGALTDAMTFDAPSPPVPDFEAMTKAEVTKVIVNNPSKGYIPGLGQMLTGEKSPADFQAELETYAKNYLAYLSDLYEYEVKRARSISLPLALANRGNVAVRDISISIRFPKSPYLQVPNTVGFLEVLGGGNWPKSPDRPSRQYDFALSALRNWSLTETWQESMADQWTIRYGDTPLASEEIEKLNAGLIADNLTALYVFVPPTDDLIQEVLDLKYWISARELPKPITGTLTLILKSSPPADPETQPGA